MKKTLFLIGFLLTASFFCFSQNESAKQKADDLAQNVFSKTKHKKKEKDGVVTEVNVKIESTPVARPETGFYEGNFWYKDLDYRIEIRSAANGSLMATVAIPGKPEVQLKSVVVKDAYFSGTKPGDAGAEEVWEGVFINRSENGVTEFGLGIKPSKPVVLSGGIQVNKFFFKKVSP